MSNSDIRLSKGQHRQSEVTFWLLMNYFLCLVQKLNSIFIITNTDELLFDCITYLHSKSDFITPFHWIILSLSFLQRMKMKNLKIMKHNNPFHIMIDFYVVSYKRMIFATPLKKGPILFYLFLDNRKCGPHNFLSIWHWTQVALN